MNFKEECFLFFSMCVGVGLVILGLIGDIWYYIFSIIIYLGFTGMYLWHYHDYKKAIKKNVYMNEVPVSKSMVHPETFSINGSFTSHD